MRSMIKLLDMVRNGEYIKDFSDDEYQYLKEFDKIPYEDLKKRLMRLDDKIGQRKLRIVIFGLLTYLLLGFILGVLVGLEYAI